MTGLLILSFGCTIFIEDNPTVSTSAEAAPSDSPPPPITAEARELGGNETFSRDFVQDVRAGFEDIVGPMLYPAYGTKIGFLDRDFNLVIGHEYSGYTYFFKNTDEGRQLKCIKAWTNKVFTTPATGYPSEEEVRGKTVYIDPQGHISATPPADLRDVETRGDTIIAYAWDNPNDNVYYDKVLLHRSTRAPITDDTFSSLIYLSDTLILAQSYEATYVLNLSGEKVQTFPGNVMTWYYDGDPLVPLRDAILSKDASALFPMWTESGDLGYVDYTGQWVIDPIYATGGFFSGDCAAVQTQVIGDDWETARWVLIDRNGQPLSDQTYADLTPLSGYGYVMQTEERIDMADLNGRVWLSLPTAGDVMVDTFTEDGLLLIRTPGESVWIDLLTREYKRLSSSDDLYEGQVLIGHSAIRYYYSDYRLPNGQPLFPDGTYSYFSDAGNFTLAHRSGWSGSVDLLDMRGRLLKTNVECQAINDMDTLGMLPGPYIWISRNAVQGYVDTQGNWVYCENAYDILDD